MNETNKFKTRLCTQSGESTLDRDKKEKSLSHKEVEVEIDQKISELMKLFDDNQNSKNDSAKKL